MMIRLVNNSDLLFVFVLFPEENLIFDVAESKIKWMNLLSFLILFYCRKGNPR